MFFGGKQSEQQKAEKIKQKSEEVRRQFNLPDTESAIQDYMCCFEAKSGRMYITANYIGWLPVAPIPGLTDQDVLLPFRKIKSVKKEKHVLVFDNSLTIETEDLKPYFFTSFVHRDETYNLIEYLMNHPPSYIDFGEEEDSIVANMKPAFVESDAARNSADDKRQSGEGGKNMLKMEYKVDTQTTKNALRIATQAREVGTDTLVELTVQAEQIDRIEGNLDNIHHNLDKTNRLLRGIESFGGSIANSMTKDNQDGRSKVVDRTLKIQAKELPPVDFEILEKMSNDHLLPALLRLLEDRFVCADPTTKKPKDGCIWTYDKIESLVLRARHQHLDIRFKGNARFRCCIGDIQTLVNELVCRTKVGQVSVIFETGTRQFKYGEASLLSSNKNKEKDESLKKSSGASAFRRGNQPKSITTTALKDVGDETKKALLEQEKDLDDISNIVGQLHGIAATMGTEIDRQTEQLDRVTTKTDSANEKMYQTNKRIDRLL